jgi:hypothetical protein
MNEDEIMKLEAGRELDALVAEKVMGWQWFDHTGYAIRYFRPPNRFNYGAIAEGKEINYLESLPHYSTDIAAAWEVAEKLGNWHGFDFLVIKAAGNDLWCAGWYEFYGDDYETRAADEAETVPLAICRAALLAAMEER